MEPNTKQEVVLVGSPTVSVSGKTEVVLVDVRVPFWSLVALLIQIAVAAIPALIILVFLGGVAMALLVGMGHMR